VIIIPDISMCDNDKCEKSLDCLRFLAEPSKYQSYICGIESICNKENGFEYFLEVKRLSKVV